MYMYSDKKFKMLIADKITGALQSQN